MNTHIKLLENQIAEYTDALVNHPLYAELNSVNTIRCFLEQHVFAVWDFMSLLKALQLKLTCTKVPWVPSGNPETRRLINEIVWGEESDVDENDKPASHYEMYIEAMKQAGANVQKMEELIHLIDSEMDVFEALKKVEMNQETREFLTFTFDAVLNKEIHVIAAIFTFGREDLIPDMFLEIVKTVNKDTQESLSKLVYYFERHIEVDGGEHGPMALNMISQLCGEDKTKWKEATDASIQALKMRINLWDGVKKSLDKYKKLEKEFCE